MKTSDGLFKLGELALVQVKSPNLYIIDMINVPQYIPNIVESVSKSKININPQVDKTAIFLKVPQVTREHRERLFKSCKLIHQNMIQKLKDIHNANIRKADNAKNTSVDTIRAIKETVFCLLSKFEMA